MRRSLYVHLRIVDKLDKRGIHVHWARRGRADLTLWDDTGIWKGMPEKLEAAIYGGLSESDQERLEKATLTGFPNAVSGATSGATSGVTSRAASAATSSPGGLSKKCLN